jgi:hypothetical protein
VVWLVEANVLEKDAFSIFMAEVMSHSKNQSHTGKVYKHLRGACCLHHRALMQIASTPEMLVNFSFYQTTWCNIPEDSHLHSVMTT